jgi:cell division inhibitor SulA
MKRLQSDLSNHPGMWTYKAQQPETMTANLAPSSLSAALEAAVHSIGQRWITVIGGHSQFIQQLVNAGIPRQRIRWLRPGKTHDRAWALEQAVLSGTSDVVVAWVSGFDKRAVQRIRLSSRLSQTQSFMFEEDVLTPHLH